MTTKKTITCIVCPLGCKILVKIEGAHCEILEGNKCKRGVDYATHEALDPRRMLTTSIRIKKGEWPLVSVKTSRPVPKDKIFSILEEIKQATVTAPVSLGDVLIKNIAETSIDIIATKTIKKSNKNYQ